VQGAHDGAKVGETEGWLQAVARCEETGSELRTRNANGKVVAGRKYQGDEILL